MRRFIYKQRNKSPLVLLALRRCASSLRVAGAPVWAA